MFVQSKIKTMNRSSKKLTACCIDLPSLPHLAGDSRILEPSPAHPPRHLNLLHFCYVD